ncbi:MAG: Transcription initiation factor TFIID subunit 12 [Chaenotheca gracillima]|nr:MAG: Transcription initiation factor TFIID subunit 12 [Chaenotheca gracillima]
MTLLDRHLEQLSLSANAISELPFPPPKIFTNALLHPHDITALIRDTEAHERALFSVSPENESRADDNKGKRRTTVFTPQESDDVRNRGRSGSRIVPRRNTTVAAVLGGDMVDQIRRGGGGGIGRGVDSLSVSAETRERGEVDVEILLRGAERLCAVYPIKGAREKIGSLRSRYLELSSSTAHYEDKVAKQAAQLDRMNRPRDYDDDEDDEWDDEDLGGAGGKKMESVVITDEDIANEEEEIRVLERKKRVLEERVSGMERDLGGLLR